MGIIENAKEVADLVKRIGDIDLYRKIIELEGEIIELTRQNRNQQEEIEELKKLVNKKQDMKFVKPFYYIDGDHQPFCPKCWEVNALSVHLTGPVYVTSGPRYDCPNCKSFFINS
jgi:thymidine phosphorylase